MRDFKVVMRSASSALGSNRTIHRALEDGYPADAPRSFDRQMRFAEDCNMPESRQEGVSALELASFRGLGSPSEQH